MQESLAEAAPELLLTIKCLLLDLQGTLELLDLNLYNATGLAPSGRPALALVKQFDPEWEDPAAYALEDLDEEDEEV